MRRLSILIYHRVLDNHDPFRPSEVTIERFDRQMRWVRRFFNVISLSQAVKHLREETLPPRALAITFDDGYKDNYTNALPVLKKHGLQATFFIATGFLNNGIMWNDVVIEGIRGTRLRELDLTRFGLSVYDLSRNRNESVNRLITAIKHLPSKRRNELVNALPKLLQVEMPEQLMMTEADVSAMSAQGMTIGGHTVSHPILTRLSEEEAKYEISEGKRYLEHLIGKPVELFAYPNGKPVKDYSQPHVDIVRDQGFDAAVSTAWGTATAESDLFQIPRFTPWDRNNVKFILRAQLMRMSKSAAVV